MSKKVIPSATENLIVVPALNRRQILGGLGALALPILGCSSDDGDGGPVGTAGAGGSPAAGAPSAGAPRAGTGVGGSPVAGAPAGGSPGVAGAQSFAGAPNGGSGMAGSGVTGGTSPGGAPGTAGGGAGGAMGGGGSGGSAMGGASAGSGGSGGGLMVPTWDNVAMCTASKTDGAGQGPFMIHDKEKSDDVSLFRQDIRGRYNMSAPEGVEMQLHLRILSSKSSGGSCDVLSDVDVYIWHTDGQGFYSGFGMPGEQKPDEPYNGRPNQNDLDTPDRFCRGVQTTGTDGVVSFRSIFPGWYNGRVVHIHFLALKKGSDFVPNRGTYSRDNSPNWLFTTQFYFQRDFTASVHEKYDPYKARTSLRDYEKSITPGSGEPSYSQLIAKASVSTDIVTAQMQILLDPRA